MKLGPDGACIRGTIPIPNYWPVPDVRKVNDQVLILQMKYRDARVARWVLGMSYGEMAKIMDCAYNTAKSRLEKAEDIMRKNL